MARAGSTVVLRAVARGAEPLEYYWKVNEEIIPGENGPTLVLNGVDETSSGLYTVTIVNPVGVASDGARLRVR